LTRNYKVLFILSGVGLDKLRAEFVSWDWRFGKSPKFNVTRTFQVPQELLGKDELTNQELSITIDVNKGIVEDVRLMVPPGLKAAKGFSGQAEVVTSLKGQRFSEEAIMTLQRALSELESPDQTRNEFVVDCMRQVVTSVWHAQFAPFKWDCWWISRNYSFMYVPYLCIKEYIHLYSKPTAALLWPWLGCFMRIQIIYNGCPNCISKISSGFYVCSLGNWYTLHLYCGRNMSVNFSVW